MRVTLWAGRLACGSNNRKAQRRTFGSPTRDLELGSQNGKPRQRGALTGPLRCHTGKVETVINSAIWGLVPTGKPRQPGGADGGAKTLRFSQSSKRWEASMSHEGDEASLDG